MLATYTTCCYKKLHLFWLVCVFYVNCCCYHGSNDDPNVHAHSPSLVRGKLLCPGHSHISNKVTEHDLYNS